MESVNRETFESTSTMNDDHRGDTSGPSSMDKAMFWLLLPAIIVVPSWMFVGRGLLGGGLGWNAIMLASTICPILFIYHCCIFLSVLRQNMRSCESCRDYHVNKALKALLVRYYAAHFFVQVFLEDGGDRSTTSAAQNLLGFNEALCAVVALTLFLISVVLMVLIAVSIYRSGGQLQQELINTRYESSVLVQSA